MIGDRIKERRVELKISQRDLAKTTGIGQAHISKIESGKIEILRYSTIHKLAKALEVPLSFFDDAYDESQEPAKAVNEHQDEYHHSKEDVIEIDWDRIPDDVLAQLVRMAKEKGIELNEALEIIIYDQLGKSSDTNDNSE
jgi:transcriptional regulator with XRE-family HTH domain